jgi:hypothetical protein
VVGQVSPAVDTRVRPVTGGEVGPERLRRPGSAPRFGAVFRGRGAALGGSTAPILRRVSGRHFDS